MGNVGQKILNFSKLGGIISRDLLYNMVAIVTNSILHFENNHENRF